MRLQRGGTRTDCGGILDNQAGKTTPVCNGYIREAGMTCQSFREQPNGRTRLAFYRSHFSWTCPWAQCPFHILRRNELTYEQKEEEKLRHQLECTRPRIQRGQPTYIRGL